MPEACVPFEKILQDDSVSRKDVIRCVALESYEIDKLGELGDIVGEKPQVATKEAK